MFKIIFITSLLSLPLFFGNVGVSNVSANVPEINSSKKVTGWLWSGNIGWISMNCEDLGTCNEVEFGVEIVGSDVIGYAWSDNVGWLRFDPVGEYPSEPLHSVRLDEEGNFFGWARFCSSVTGGDCDGETRADWDGWVLFDSENPNWAWGEYVGWISLTCENEDLCESIYYGIEI